MILLKKLVGILCLTVFAFFSPAMLYAGEAGEALTVTETDPILALEALSASESGIVYYLSIRVIFAGATGIFGNVDSDLLDMKEILTESFRYPSFELSNRIRLSLFGEEEVMALVFPEHYLRLIPKGSSRDGKGLKIKAELYHVPQEHNARIRFYMGERPNTLQYQEKQKKEKESEHTKRFPIASSAMILRVSRWDAFGGIPVHVNSQGQVRSNTLSSSPITNRGALGKQKFLILGISLEKVDH